MVAVMFLQHVTVAKSPTGEEVGELQLPAIMVLVGLLTGVSTGNDTAGVTPAALPAFAALE